MSNIYRYRLQRKEQISRPCIIGNRSYPLPTYRWKDIAVSNDKAALETGITDWEKYRVVDTLPEPPKEEEDEEG